MATGAAEARRGARRGGASLGRRSRPLSTLAVSVDFSCIVQVSPSSVYGLSTTRKPSAILLTTALVGLATLASGQQPVAKTAAARPFRIQPGPARALSKADGAKVAQTFSAAAKAYASTKDSKPLFVAGATLPATAKAAYITLAEGLVSANTSAQMAARYGIQSGQLVSVSWTGCSVHATLDLTLKNHGAAVPANVTPKVHGLYGMWNAYEVTANLPKLGAGATATVRLPEIVTSTDAAGGGCKPLEVSLALTGISTMGSYVLSVTQGGEATLSTAPASGGVITVGPPPGGPGPCGQGARLCGNVCVPSSLNCPY